MNRWRRRPKPAAPLPDAAETKREFLTIFTPEKTATGQFCWLDLAASDAGSAKTFYQQLFGWTAHEQRANGGSFTRLRLSEHDIGSLYQLRPALIEHHVPSHWTPYVRVDDVEATAKMAAALGGEVIVRPFAVAGVARIALVLDAVGAQIGLWQPLDGGSENTHG